MIYIQNLIPTKSKENLQKKLRLNKFELFENNIQIISHNGNAEELLKQVLEYIQIRY